MTIIQKRIIDHLQNKINYKFFIIHSENKNNEIMCSYVQRKSIITKIINKGGHIKDFNSTNFLSKKRS